MRLVVPIQGMYCAQCEVRVTRALDKVAGITVVSVSGNTAHVIVDETECDGSQAKARIVQAIDASGYAVRETAISEESSTDHQTQHVWFDVQRFRIKIQALAQFFIAIIGIFAASKLLEIILGRNIFNTIPLIDSNQPIGLLFFVGLATSLHCITMCGAINLAVSGACSDESSPSALLDASSMGKECVQSCSQQNGLGVRSASLRRSLFYHVGRLISYTALGGLAGALGGIISMDRRVSTVLIILAAVFMLVLALKSAGIVSLRSIHLPGSQKINQAIQKRFGPFVVGLANGAMPCGPLFAMQMYALSTGSALAGAASMLLFCLGTIPLMLVTSQLAAQMSMRSRSLMMRIAAAFMFVLAASMLARGLSIAGINAPQQLLFSSNTLTAPQSQVFQQAKQEDGVQEVEFDLSFDAYQDIEVTRGIPVRMIIHADEEHLTGCNGEVLLPEWGIDQPLHVGENIIEFIPDKTGEFSYSCWMNMITNTVRVVE